MIYKPISHHLNRYAMTILFKGDTIILKDGREIIFESLKKVNGKTVGVFGTDGIFYPLNLIEY